jgi:hypothetical protein
MAKSIKPGFRKPQAYRGELAEPIYLPIVAGDSSKRSTPELTAEATYRKIIKFHKLFEFYKIDPLHELKWYRLALALAEQHVRGFHVVYGVRPKRGRRRSWKAGLGEDLASDVKSLTSQNKMTTTEAIKQLNANSSTIWSKYTIPNLTTRHREALRTMRERHRLASELRRSGLIAGLGNLPSTDGK